MLALFVATTAAAAPDDAAMGERLRACTACHGADSIRIEEGYVPRIRGKPAGYLFNQLVSYRRDQRYDDTMRHMVRYLSDAYLSEIAAYFASREAPYPAPGRPSANAATLERGETLVRHGDPSADIPPCEACHGERLAGVLPATPGLIGLPRHYIMAQLGAWRADKRHAAPPDCMSTVANRLSPRDVQAVAAWLSSRPLPNNTEPRQRPMAQTPLQCGSFARPEVQ